VLLLLLLSVRSSLWGGDWKCGLWKLKGREGVVLLLEEVVENEGEKGRRVYLPAGAATQVLQKKTGWRTSKLAEGGRGRKAGGDHVPFPRDPARSFVHLPPSL
jgi:hypothetical protein